MFWDGSRWVDETPKPTASLAPKKRRVRDWAATSLIGFALVALVIPNVGTSASTSSTVASWSTSYNVTSLQENNTTRIDYNGHWQRHRHSNYSGGYVRSTDQRRAGATITFNGSAVAWIGPVGPTRGSARVYVDGTYVKTISTYASRFRTSAVLFQTEFDGYGRHTLRFVALGTKGHPTVAIDKVVVRGKAKSNRQELPAPPAVDSTPAPTEAPATEAPATEAPATEAPATEAPATEAPATEAPATEAPATEAPATEPPPAAPTISDVTATPLAATSARIQWTVSAPATGQVEYGTSSAYGKQSALESSFDYTTHIQQLDGLTAGTTYHYRVRSTTESGVSLVSDDLTFKTSAATAAVTPAPTPAPTPVATPAPTAAATPAPTPVATPTPTPTSTTRPFAAPTTTRTVTVPSTIDSTGATNAGAALQTFINSVPDGSVIVFKAGGIYRLDRGIFLVNRHHLVFDGNGATVRSNGSNTLIASSPFVIDGANSDIAVRDFTIEGNNPRTGTDIYNLAGENQQGVAIYGGTRIEIANNTIRKLWGDAIYANEKDTTHTWTTDLWVHHNAISYVGRMAFTMNGVRGALIERNTVDRIGGSVMDIEPDTTLQGAINVTLRHNTIGVYGMTPQYTQWFVACANDNYGPGAVVRNITITANHVSAGAPSSTNTPNAGGLATWIGKTRTANIIFTNNTTTKSGSGPVLRFEHVDGLTVAGNTQPLTSGSLTSVRDSTNVSVSQ